MKEEKKICFTDSFNVDHDLFRFFCFKEFFGEIVEYFFLRSHAKKSIQIILGIGIHQQRQTALLKSSRSRLIDNCLDINLIADLSVQYFSLKATADRQ